ncbi:hypothetical protein HSR122_2185 [Halapricum desulfuricans]|uniref:Uncharacterized protein n=1 Tax=Halapricum desulfuricans TaxID=2841257 RepID=A0A897NGU3_9EURY|nr:hypothetical protein HSR122_2185 [Halapricum desulfuricans]
MTPRYVRPTIQRIGAIHSGAAASAAIVRLHIFKFVDVHAELFHELL